MRKERCCKLSKKNICNDDIDVEELLYEGDLYDEDAEEETPEIFDDALFPLEEEETESLDDGLEEDLDDTVAEDEVEIPLEITDEEVLRLAAELEKEISESSNEALFDRYHNDKTLTDFEREDLLNEIAKKNLKTIYYIVNKRRSFENMIPLDEMTNAGFVGYAKAIDKYDPSRGVKFATFAINCIKNEISFCLRKERKHYDHNISTDFVKHHDKNGNDLKVEDTLMDTGMTPEEIVRHQTLQKTIKDNIDLLSPIEKYVITYRYGLDRNITLTQKQIATLVDMSQANISKIERNCLDKLRDLMNLYNE